MQNQTRRNVSIGYGGQAYAGSYCVVGDSVRVSCLYGSREGLLWSAGANPESVAQVLLRELVHAQHVASRDPPHT